MFVYQQVRLTKVYFTQRWQVYFLRYCLGNQRVLHQNKNTMVMQDNLKTFTVKEVAGILKVSKTQIQKLEKAGVLKPIDWGSNLNKNRARRRFVRYSLETIESFLKGDKKGGGDE